MKLTATIVTSQKGLRVVRFQARIPQSKKLGIKRKQKTWRFKTVAPQTTMEEMRSSVEAEAKRWEAKILGKTL